MKPVAKGDAPDKYSRYGDAKPDLIGKIGQQCSYCEAPGKPQSLHVEHIYPKKPHPKRETEWENFLLSCVTCNSYKNKHLGDKRQRSLAKRYLWPHLDNTFFAFIYKSDGSVGVNPALSVENQILADAILKMAGILKSPAAAKDYEDLAIAYDGIDNRAEAWAIVVSQRRNYVKDPTPQGVADIAQLAPKIGYFSIWMTVFGDRPEVRQALIASFKADSNCFDANTAPILKGRV